MTYVADQFFYDPLFNWRRPIAHGAATQNFRVAQSRSHDQPVGAAGRASKLRWSRDLDILFGKWKIDLHTFSDSREQTSLVPFQSKFVRNECRDTIRNIHKDTKDFAGSQSAKVSFETFGFCSSKLETENCVDFKYNSNSLHNSQNWVLLQLPRKLNRKVLLYSFVWTW